LGGERSANHAHRTADDQRRGEGQVRLGRARTEVVRGRGDHGNGQYCRQRGPGRAALVGARPQGQKGHDQETAADSEEAAGEPGQRADRGVDPQI
jgi:hypothetical protein